MCAIFENLETRRLMSAAVRSAVLRVYGGGGDDQVILGVERGNIVVTTNGARDGTFARTAIRSILIDVGDGEDYVSVSPNIRTSVKIFGRGGDDLLFGGSGNDMLDGGAGDDVLRGRGGDDRLLPGTGSNTADGAAGLDTVDYATAERGMEVDLRDQSAWYNVRPDEYDDEGDAVDTFAGIENVDGSPFGDFIIGSKSSTLLRGGDGSDELRANYQTATTLRGGEGDDRLTDARQATNLLDGGSGADTVNYDWHSASVMVTLDNLANDGEPAENDFVKDCENINGTYSADTLVGNDGPNGIDGKSGDDVITGLSGNDTLSGSYGNDRIDGGLGSDVLDGGADNDTLIGGAGLDSFDGGAGDDVFQTRDGVRELVFGGAGNDKAWIDSLATYSNVDDALSDVEATSGYGVP